MRHYAIAETKIIKIKHRNTEDQGYKIIIQPSGRELHFPFDTTDTAAEDSNNALEKEECLEPMSNKKYRLSPTTATSI